MDEQFRDLGHRECGGQKQEWKWLFDLLKDQALIRDHLEKEIERLSIENDAKQQKIDYYEGTYFTIEAAAKERMEIIERQQQEIEKYRRESIFRPLRKLKALFGGRAG